jgi:hypothetical protein
MLFPLWSGALHRPTRDLDLLGFGEHTIEQLKAAFRAICAIAVEDDGLTFEPATIRGAIIKRGQPYEGVRLRFQARLGETRIPIHVDIGFGDAVTPEAQVVAYPTLLNFPPPAVRAYPVETVVAEKYQAVVDLADTNSRMKDFYDLWMLATTMGFDGTILSAAIANTFDRRGTPLPDGMPVGLTTAWATGNRTAGYWLSFLERSNLFAETPRLEIVVGLLREFLLPPTSALLAGVPFEMQWSNGGPWTD